MAITNAFVLYKIQHPDGKVKKILQFREALAIQLIGDYCSRRRRGWSNNQVKTLSLQHFPQKKCTDEGHKRGRCSLCREVLQRVWSLAMPPWHFRGLLFAVAQETTVNHFLLHLILSFSFFFLHAPGHPGVHQNMCNSLVILFTCLDRHAFTYMRLDI